MPPTGFEIDALAHPWTGKPRATAVFTIVRRRSLALGISLAMLETYRALTPSPDANCAANAAGLGREPIQLHG